ncbi:hypothetical protein GSS88_10450 [Corynebacterium sp. 3HC-13]|uniref:hypothetical protein n=1 Tax=Corynebacterium poyangense TaxID=2684405 RepID=UPI001CC97ACB|nr:hypothetical protein [Corynebacterium poyangense]MBZ8178201.1 hypothetical protein [Corynebacterium poyangense]
MHRERDLNKLLELREQVVAGTFQPTYQSGPRLVIGGELARAEARNDLELKEAKLAENTQALLDTADEVSKLPSLQEHPKPIVPTIAWAVIGLVGVLVGIMMISGATSIF